MSGSIRTAFRALNEGRAAAEAAWRRQGSRTVPPQLPFSVIANFRTTGYERCVRHAGAGPGFGMIRLFSRTENFQQLDLTTRRSLATFPIPSRPATRPPSSSLQPSANSPDPAPFRTTSLPQSSPYTTRHTPPEQPKSDPPGDDPQRPLSHLLAGLGIVFGSTSMPGNPLAMQEEDEEDDQRAERGGRADRRSFSVEPGELEDRDYEGRSESGSDLFESADEGEDGAWTKGRRASKRFPRRGSRDKLSSARPTLFTIPDHPPISHDLKTRTDCKELSFGTAPGGYEDPPPDDDSPTTLQELVRQSWRFVEGGSHDFTPAQGRRISQRVAERRRIRSDAEVENLHVPEVEPRRRSLNSITHSPRPLPPPKSHERPVASSQRSSLIRPSPEPYSPSPTTSFHSPPPSASLDWPQPFQSAAAPSSSLEPIDPSSFARPRAVSQGQGPSLSFLDTKPPARPSGRADSSPKGRVVSEPTLRKSKSAVRLSALFKLGRSRSDLKADGVQESLDSPSSPSPPLPPPLTRRRAASDVSSPFVSIAPPPLPPKSPATPSKVSLRHDIPSTPPLPAGTGASPFSGRTWRSTMDSAEFETLSIRYGPQEMRRQEVIWELYETEKAFVTSLRGVLRIFSLPLRMPNGSWIKGVPMGVSRLFDWLDDIVSLHAQIATALESARISHHPLVLNVAEAILPVVARLDIHLPYLVRFETVTKAIEAMTVDVTSDFGEFVRLQSSLPECAALSLGSFLLKPVQRLMKYPLFFKQLCDLTPSAHPDYLPILSLLHSTDAMIRIMQEVKSREDDYDEAEALQSRFRGLPDGFQLARRDRRLLVQGQVHQVHLRDKDRALLETDAFASATVPQRKGSDTSLLYPITVSSFNPTPERSRPQSVVSDSGSSRRSAGSISFSDADASSGGTSPPTPDSFTIPSHQRLHPSKPLRLDSSFSSSVHRLRSDSLASETLDYSKEQSPPLSPASTLSGVIVKGKGKESPLHVFVFSDLVVLARKKEEGGRFKRSSTSSHKSEHEATYKVVDTIGLSSILSVLDLSGKTGHDHLLRIDVVPIASPSSPPASFISNASLAHSIYLTLPSRPSSPSQRHKDHTRWLQALHHSSLRPVSFGLLCVPVTPEEHEDAELERSSPEGLEDGVGDEEGEERRFWAARFGFVRREMEGRRPERRSEG